MIGVYVYRLQYFYDISVTRMWKKNKKDGSLKTLIPVFISILFLIIYFNQI